jgi:DNA-binding GntR family transcriptional regulator
MAKAKPRTEIAYQALKQAIIEQALRPGAKLPEDKIGGLFGMSRTLVREILSRLKSDGLVEANARRSATVARPSLEEAADIFELRRALEREAVALAILRWKPEYGAILAGHIREENAAKNRNDERLSIRLAGDFHVKLARMSGNVELERMLSGVVSRCSLIQALYARPHSSDCAIAEHSAIAAAMREGDAAKAIKLADEHVGLVERRALIANKRQDAPNLGDVLSRYARAIETRAAAFPLLQRKRA